ncbi:CueP family metal-binding protein [Ornithinimicrobium panacihumi]|uniref:CueP family metal-binding protein n=1 Tax=Ornithinimicrobium panacihumi TaxID=2008449 RepID=UPI003F88835F
MRTAAALSLLTAVTLALSGCSTAQDQPRERATSAAASQTSTHAAALPEPVAAQLAALGVPTDDVKELITTLDQVEQARPLAVQASVRHDEVILTDGQQEATLAVPGDEVYVSVAPYVHQTHDCFFHALGGCQGELVGEQVHVTITDSDGEVLVDEDATTYANGFVGYWLPKDRTGTIEITQGDRSGMVELDTGPDGATCITTLQLR